MEFKFGLLVLLGVLGFVRCTPCSRVESVNISTGVQFENGSVVHDDVEYTTDLWYEAEEDGETVRFGCPCVGRTCLWKCCPAGSMLITRTCEPTDMEAVNPFRPPVHKGQEMTTIDATQHFFYMYNSLCIFRYLVDANEAGVELYVQEDATLYEIANGKHQWISPTMYCADMMLSNETLGPQFVALVCYPEATDDSSVLYIAYAVGLLLSVPFLLATFLVYAIIPELRNLHGMSLMAYCSGLIVAYPFLAYLKFNSGQVNMTIGACRAIAFVVYYAFQTSFFWLNVMCFDIWRTFSGYRGGGSTKQRERRRFMLYGLYAWGVPLLLTALLIFMQYYPDLPEAILRPGLGEMRCWFDDWKTEVLYFYSSVWTLVICNVVLFSVTAHRIRSIRQETAILKSSESSRSDRLKRDKQRYALYLKLFVVMGVNWTVEIISFIAGGSNWFWIVVDLSNLALGIVIFFIFVWKNKVRNLVRKKIAKWRGVPLDGPSTLSDSGAGRWATRSSSAPTEVTRVTSTDDAGVRLRDLR